MNWRNRKRGEKWEKTGSKKSGKVEEKQGEKGENVKRESTSIRYQFLTSTANNITQSIEQQPSTNYY